MRVLTTIFAFGVFLFILFLVNIPIKIIKFCISVTYLNPVTKYPFTIIVAININIIITLLLKRIGMKRLYSFNIFSSIIIILS